MKAGSPKLAARWLHAALLLFVLASVGNIQNHRCLDGLEPPLSVHFETFNSHVEHDDGTYIADVESDAIPQGILAKNSNEDGEPYVITGFAVLNLHIFPHTPRIELVPLIVPFQPFTVVPPSRAPPAHSS